MASLGNEAFDRPVGHPQRTRATTMDTRRSHQVRLRFHTHHHAPIVNANAILRKQTHHWHSVGDADDFRLYHTPGFGWRWPFKIRRVPTRRKGGLPYHSCAIPRDSAVFSDDRFERSDGTCSDRGGGRARGTHHAQLIGGIALDGTAHRVLITVVPDNPTPQRA